MRLSTRARTTEHDAIRRGIWAPFRSLLLAQVLSAILGLVFWVLVAHLVPQRDVGIAAAAISLQTVLGIVTVMGLGTMLISELPMHSPARQRVMVRRSMLVVLGTSMLVGLAVVAAQPLLPGNLHDALDNPIGAATFVAGVVGAAWALVVDDSALAVRRSHVQVGRNLLASSLRFPLTAVLLAFGFTQSHVLQLCWVLPLVTSVPVALRWLRLPPGDHASPPFRADVTSFGGLAIRNHLLSLSLASASQMVPVVAGLTLTSVDNAEFAIAWLMATFVFLPPYLLSTALFAHGASVSPEEFRTSMERTIPAALLLSLALCVGAWTLGQPILTIFGGKYAHHSWPILALLVPGGLWMVFKDHLVALWRTERRYALATRLAFAALLLEIVGAAVGALLDGATGLGIGWLSAMLLEVIIGAPWLRQAFGGLHFRWPLHLPQRSQAGRALPQVAGVLAFVVIVGGIGYWTTTSGGEGKDGAGPNQPSATSSNGATPPDSCRPTANRPGPAIDLGVQAASGNPHHPINSFEKVRSLVRLAKKAGASVISTSASFRTMQPEPGVPINYQTIDRTIGAARTAGLKVKLQLVGMPIWALDDPSGDLHQAPRSEAELQRWATFVRAVMKHVNGKVDYLEVWNEPNGDRWWPTGPNPVEFVRLLAATYDVVHDVSPSTLVVTGGLIGNDIGFLDKMYDAMKTIHLKAPPFDMVGVHPFTGSAAPDRFDAGKRYTRDPYGLFDENFTGFTGLHDVMKEHGDGDLQIYITEFGYSTKGAPHRRAVPDAKRATYLTEALEQTTCVPYVSIFAWYALHPSKWDPADWTMLDRAGHPNQTYAAMMAWAHQVATATGGGTAAAP